MEKNRLKRMKLNEISLVDRPANKLAQVLIAKRKDDGTVPNSLADVLNQNLRKALQAVLDNSDDAETVIDKAMNDITKALTDGDGGNDDKTDLEKRLDQLEEIIKASMTDEERKAFEKMPMDEKQKFMSMDSKQRKAWMKKSEDGGDGEGKETPTIKMEDLPSDVRKRLENADKLEARIAKMEAEQREAEIEKQAEPYKNIVDTEVLKGVLDVLDSDVSEKLLGELKKAQTLVEKSDLMKEVGFGKSVESGSALGKLNQIAKAEQKANPKLTKEQAFIKVYEDPDNAEIVKQYTSERKGK